MITGYKVEYKLRSLKECEPQPPQRKHEVTKDSPNLQLVADDLLPASVYDIIVTAYTSLPGEPSKKYSYSTPEARKFLVKLFGGHVRKETSGVFFSQNFANHF